ncbi:MAG: hypothetical protein H0X31_02125 [Nostocaceae cyanobacterium]|nr:hypothetical protein [Nostocaceae cyanobacterium]
MEFPTAFLDDQTGAVLARAKRAGTFPPLGRAVTLAGDGGLANLSVSQCRGLKRRFSLQPIKCYTDAEHHRLRGMKGL